MSLIELVIGGVITGVISATMFALNATEG